MVKVKICGLTRREDVEAAVALGADAVGFVFEPTSPRCLTSEQGLKLAMGLPPFVTRVGVSGTTHDNIPYELLDAVQAITFKMPHVPRTMQVYRRKPDATVAEVIEAIGPADALVLDAFSSKGLGGTGEKIDWGVAAEIVAESPKPVILAGGLNPENVKEAIHRVHPYAVDVASGVEISPGIKDPELIKRFIQNARGA